MNDTVEALVFNAAQATHSRHMQDGLPNFLPHGSIFVFFHVQLGRATTAIPCSVRVSLIYFLGLRVTLWVILEVIVQTRRSQRITTDYFVDDVYSPDIRGLEGWVASWIFYSVLGGYNFGLSIDRSVFFTFTSDLETSWRPIYIATASLVAAQNDKLSTDYQNLPHARSHVWMEGKIVSPRLKSNQCAYLRRAHRKHGY